MPGSGEFSRAPGWLARTAHWSDGENLKTGPDLSTELFPKLGDELWSSLGDHIHGKALNQEDVVHHHLCCLLGGGEFGQGNKMGRFGEAIHHHQNHGVASRWGKARDKIKGQVWPRARGNWQSLQQTNRRPVRNLIWAHTPSKPTQTAWHPGPWMDTRIADGCRPAISEPLDDRLP